MLSSVPGRGHVAALLVATLASGCFGQGPPAQHTRNYASAERPARVSPALSRLNINRTLRLVVTPEFQDPSVYSISIGKLQTSIQRALAAARLHPAHSGTPELTLNMTVSRLATMRSGGGYRIFLDCEFRLDSAVGGVIGQPLSLAGYGATTRQALTAVVDKVALRLARGHELAEVLNRLDTAPSPQIAHADPAPRPSPVQSAPASHPPTAAPALRRRSDPRSLAVVIGVSSYQRGLAAIPFGRRDA